ncbi:hypothetical protein BMG523Draft_00097 [Frankia sp. BMG5.23]|nr:hypothetical protein BMG523Draft_00097 [Frankia sp. BMG5.23]
MARRDRFAEDIPTRAPMRPHRRPRRMRHPAAPQPTARRTVRRTGDPS